MPRADKPCSVVVPQQCTDVAVRGESRCAVHLAEAEQRRGSAAARGYDTRWRRTRAAYLRTHRTCECTACAALPRGLRPQATDVDHIDGLGPLGTHGHDSSNLRAMTHGHHARRTAQDQPGGWHAQRY